MCEFVWFVWIDIRAFEREWKAPSVVGQLAEISAWTKRLSGGCLCGCIKSGIKGGIKACIDSGWLQKHNRFDFELSDSYRWIPEDAQQVRTVGCVRMVIGYWCI